MKKTIKRYTKNKLLRKKRTKGIKRTKRKKTSKRTKRTKRIKRNKKTKGIKINIQSGGAHAFSNGLPVFFGLFSEKDTEFLKSKKSHITVLQLEINMNVSSFYKENIQLSFGQIAKGGKIIPPKNTIIKNIKSVWEGTIGTEGLKLYKSDFRQFGTPPGKIFKVVMYNGVDPEREEDLFKEKFSFDNFRKGLIDIIKNNISPGVELFEYEIGEYTYFGPDSGNKHTAVFAKNTEHHIRNYIPHIQPN
jgi:hypothetical protein